MSTGLILPPGEPETAESSISAKDRIDFSWRTLVRLDSYIAATNTKAAVLLTLNTFVVGTLTLKWADVSEFYANYAVAATAAGIVVLIATAASLCSMVYALRAINPVLASPKEPNVYHSLVFFEHISEHGTADLYSKAVAATTPQKVAEDLAKQSHALAQITKGKFQNLTVAARWLAFGLLPSLGVLLVIATAVTLCSLVKGGN